MPVSPATGPGDQAAFLVQARKLYVASKFKSSLVHFKMALVKCSCNRDMVIAAKKMGISLKEISIPTCHCKDLNALSMAANPDKLAMYNLATKPCTCGSGLVPCDLPAHLGAIEGVAAAYDKLQAHSKALKYASLYVIMAPHAPEGYLRMAKALRLMDTSQSPDTNARCVWIYHQAIESILYSLLRKDFIVSLPSELQAMVLQYLSQAELCRCMRVTKLWNQACRNPVLWRDLEFKFTADTYESRTGERFQSSFDQLEHLRLTDSQFSHENDRLRGTFIEALSWLLGLLAPSISNGTLTSLDIPFDNDIRAELDQVLDKQSISSLNFNALPPPPSFQMSGLLSPIGDALLTWLESFPNLETVGLFPNDREACAMMVAKILSKESNIRTIYTNELVGVYYDDALAKAEKIGVRIIRADRVPEPVLKPLGKKSKVEEVSSNS
ncbi:hypothetical protein VSDG_04241 [Cytospora chrysosperma]|uniref:F-box domain-containing protein n=1 Tax=Cytospora chrysosperma TaxID=252740 RepID=A0A423W5L1_CYTCH|nr:hypothetical protein VSDG_04241 [Valsa sordida]